MISDDTVVAQHHPGAQAALVVPCLRDILGLHLAFATASQEVFTEGRPGLRLLSTGGTGVGTSIGHFLYQKFARYHVFGEEALVCHDIFRWCAFTIITRDELLQGNIVAASSMHGNHCFVTENVPGTKAALVVSCFN